MFDISHFEKKMRWMLYREQLKNWGWAFLLFVAAIVYAVAMARRQ